MTLCDMVKLPRECHRLSPFISTSGRNYGKPEEAGHEVMVCFFFTNMKPFAEAFYKSKAWQDCSAAYKAKTGGLCERCLEQGVYTPADLVHHKVWLTPENINDPMITLNWSNLKAVCSKCHAAEHRPRERRYTVDQDGRVTVRK